MSDSVMMELVRRVAATEARLARLEEQEQGPGAVYLTAQLVSGAWDGDVKTSANNGILDLSALFGVPAGIKAVLASMTTYSTTGNISLVLKPTSAGASAPPINVHTVASQYANRSGWVPCDANGDVYFSSSSATGANVWIDIWGYAR